MKKYIYKNGKNLKYGYTTGSCAAGAVKAATYMVLNQKACHEIKLETPKGWPLNLQVEDISIGPDWASCAIRKDAGDDPDITHGLLIYAHVSLSEIDQLIGGKGIGKITRPGLSLPVGSDAINPTPRKMIEKAIEEVKNISGYEGAFKVVLTVPGGEKISLKTFNPKLGIMGGISIIGTTGIVEPMSEDAFKESLALELNQKKQNMMVFTPGNYGCDFCLEHGVNKDKIIKVSNFMGYMFEQAASSNVNKILCVGHIGKLVKIAGGIFHTHSRVADARMEIICACLIEMGTSTEILQEILGSNTTDEAVDKIYAYGLEGVFIRLAYKIKYKLQAYVFDAIEVEVIIFSLKYKDLASTKDAKKWIRCMYE